MLISKLHGFPQPGEFYAVTQNSDKCHRILRQRAICIMPRNTTVGHLIWLELQQLN